MVNETQQPYFYAGDDPVNGVDPMGLWGWNLFSDASQLLNDATTEVTSHWRGLTKIAILAVVVVGTSACVLATAGICGAAAFTVGGFEVSGGAIAVGFAAGAGEGAIDYTISCEPHTLEGYFQSAAIGGAEDAVFAGIPEEVLFGNTGRGLHAAELNYLEALRYIPGYLSSAWR
jgi:hypothetical protein